MSPIIRLPSYKGAFFKLRICLQNIQTIVELLLQPRSEHTTKKSVSRNLPFDKLLIDPWGITG